MQMISASYLREFDQYFFYFALFVYLLGTAAFLLYLARTRPGIARLAFYLTCTAFGAHSLLLIFRYITYNYFPVTDLHQSLFFFGWCLVGVFIIFNIRDAIPAVGSFITPVAALFLISSATLFTGGPIPIPPSLKSIWLPIHSTLAFLGEAFLGLAGCVGVMYLLQEKQIKKKQWSLFFRRLPSLQALDDINYRCLCFGFLFLTVGIITGSIWAEYAWGSYWNWDPKENWALVTWLLYAALLHGRLIIGWRGRRAAIFSIIGFVVVLFTFLGVNLLFPGLHSYESLTSQTP